MVRGKIAFYMFHEPFLIMKVKIISEDEEKVINVDDEEIKIEDLLRKEGINPVTVLVKKNEELVPVEDTVKDGDILELIPVVSGG